jgi:hypothetical protein
MRPSQMTHLLEIPEIEQNNYTLQTPIPPSFDTIAALMEE